MAEKNRQRQGPARRLGGPGHRRKGKPTPGRRSQQAGPCPAQHPEKGKAKRPKRTERELLEDYAVDFKGWVGGIIIDIMMMQR